MNKPIVQSQTQPAVATAEAHHLTHLGTSVITEPQHDDIARLAYDLYVKTGRQEGHCTRNWQQAERTLRDQASGYGHATH